jgi:hypothetical protein
MNGKTCQNCQKSPAEYSIYTSALIPVTVSRLSDSTIAGTLDHQVSIEGVYCGECLQKMGVKWKYRYPVSKETL